MYCDDTSLSFVRILARGSILDPYIQIKASRGIMGCRSCIESHRIRACPRRRQRESIPMYTHPVLSTINQNGLFDVNFNLSSINTEIHPNEFLYISSVSRKQNEVFSWMVNPVNWLQLYYFEFSERIFNANPLRLKIEYRVE